MAIDLSGIENIENAVNGALDQIREGVENAIRAGLQAIVDVGAQAQAALDQLDAEPAEGTEEA